MNFYQLVRANLNEFYFRSKMDEHEQQKIMSMTKEMLNHFKASHLNIYYKVCTKCDNHYDKSISPTKIIGEITINYICIFCNFSGKALGKYILYDDEWKHCRNFCSGLYLSVRFARLLNGVWHNLQLIKYQIQHLNFN